MRREDGEKTKDNSSTAGAGPFPADHTAPAASDSAKAITCKALCRNHLSGFAEPCAEACITGAGVAFDCEHAPDVWGSDAQHVLDALDLPSTAAAARDMLKALEDLSRFCSPSAEYTTKGAKAFIWESAIAAIAAAKAAGIKTEG